MSLLLLSAVTVLYAGYNLLVKVSGSHVPDGATTTILATICLQLAALATSVLFASVLLIRGGAVLQLSSSAYLWAVAAGLCIGGAEIAYFYLFSGVGSGTPMSAGTAIPTIVSGTILIAMIVSVFLFKESTTWSQLAGAACIVVGIVLLFIGRQAPAG